MAGTGSIITNTHKCAYPCLLTRTDLVWRNKAMFGSQTTHVSSPSPSLCLAMWGLWLYLAYLMYYELSRWDVFSQAPAKSQVSMYLLYTFQIFFWPPVTPSSRRFILETCRQLGKLKDLKPVFKVTIFCK